MKRIVILGSTGSIGRQTLDVVERNPYELSVVGLVAGKNFELLASQVRKFKPSFVAISGAEEAGKLLDLLGNDFRSLHISHGLDAMVRAARQPEADIVVAAMVGAAGLAPTYAALEAGKRVALANKEPMVLAGELMRRCAAEHGAEIIPVDSEHSGIFQSLRGHNLADASFITLTASGGPFREKPLDQFHSITVEEALRHPNWAMGPKVTIDSATMMNKGLEIIEAHWLFDFPVSKINVVIHPQSIVHAMVSYKDGSVIAQMAAPDMRAPISYALGLPARLESGIETLQLCRNGSLTFYEPDDRRYPCMKLARRALEDGGSMPAVLNAANEVAVEAFLEGRIPFTGIHDLVESALSGHSKIVIGDLETAMAVDSEARASARSFIAKVSPS